VAIPASISIIVHPCILLIILCHHLLLLLFIRLMRLVLALVLLFRIIQGPPYIIIISRHMEIQNWLSTNKELGVLVATVILTTTKTPIRHILITKHHPRHHQEWSLVFLVVGIHLVNISTIMSSTLLFQAVKKREILMVGRINHTITIIQEIQLSPALNTMTILWYQQEGSKWKESNKIRIIRQIDIMIMSVVLG
jgi:hypothetical protein